MSDPNTYHPHPNVPLYLQERSARPAKIPSFLACLLGLFFNYWPKVETKSGKARVIRGFHFEEHERERFDGFLGLGFSLAWFEKETTPETWILTLELPDKSRLAVAVDEHIYNRHIVSSNMPINDTYLWVDYQEGRCDGLPRLVETGCGISHLPRYVKA